MKIRNGFVSNSSSSSFVVAMSKLDHDRIVLDLDCADKLVVIEKKINGLNMVLVRESTGVSCKKYWIEALNNGALTMEF